MDSMQYYDETKIMYATDLYISSLGGFKLVLNQKSSTREESAAAALLWILEQEAQKNDQATPSNQ